MLKSLFALAVAALTGCTAPASALTASDAQDATVLLNAARVDASTYLADTGMGTGTAWVVAPGYLLTAGHVCALAMDTGRLWLRDPAGEVISAHPVIFEVSDGPEADACLLKADGPTMPPLPLAGLEPRVGAPDGMVGYPLRSHAIVTGTYEGHGQDTDPTDHGNSGSPVFTPNGVYLLCTQLREDGKPGCAGTPAAELHRLLQRAGL